MNMKAVRLFFFMSIILIALIAIIPAITALPYDEVNVCCGATDLLTYDYDTGVSQCYANPECFWVTTRSNCVEGGSIGDSCPTFMRGHSICGSPTVITNYKYVDSSPNPSGGYAISCTYDNCVSSGKVACTTTWGDTMCCASGQTCTYGECITPTVQPECTTNAQCGTGNICSSNHCCPDWKFWTADYGSPGGCYQCDTSDRSRCGSGTYCVASTGSCSCGANTHWVDWFSQGIPLETYGCVCNAGYKDCNGDRGSASYFNDGCEINTQTDPNNCGSCGTKCTSLQSCGYIGGSYIESTRSATCINSACASTQTRTCPAGTDLQCTTGVCASAAVCGIANKADGTSCSGITSGKTYCNSEYPDRVYYYDWGCSGGTCTDEGKTDSYHSCSSGQTCVNGLCKEIDLCLTNCTECATEPRCTEIKPNDLKCDWDSFTSSCFKRTNECLFAGDYDVDYCCVQIGGSILKRSPLSAYVNSY